MGHRNTLNKLFELRGEGEGERVKGPRVIRSQGANSAIFRHTLERAFNTTSKGATGKPRVLPNSDILAIPHNPAHSLTKQLNPMSKGGPNVRSTHPMVPLNIGECGKYLAFKMRAHIVSGLVYRH